MSASASKFELYQGDAVVALLIFIHFILKLLGFFLQFK